MKKNPTHPIEQFIKPVTTLFDVAKNHALNFRQAAHNDRWKLAEEIKFKFSLLQDFYDITSNSLFKNILDNIEKDSTSWKEAKSSITLSVKDNNDYKFITATKTRMPIILERAIDEFKEKIKTSAGLNTFLNSITQAQNINNFELGEYWALGDRTVENGLMLSVYFTLEQELKQYPYIPIFLIDPATSAIIHTIQIPEETLLPENFRYSINIGAAPSSQTLSGYDSITKTLLAVHNGYFFGGNRYSAYPNKTYAPQDCSSLLNLLLSKTNIITTKILSDLFVGKENEDNKEFFTMFKSTPLEVNQLSVGDVIGWRKGNAGHVGFIVEIDSKAKVGYLSLTRDLEEFNKEGYMIETLDLQDSSKDFFALRPTETYIPTIEYNNKIYESNLPELEKQHYIDEMWLDKSLTPISGNVETEVCIN